MAEVEETADPIEEIYYTTAELKRTEDGDYKCVACLYNAKVSQTVVHHISTKHPEFVHKPRKYSKHSNDRGKIKRTFLRKWSAEELSDPNILMPMKYTTSQLERKDGRYKCFQCPYSSTNSTNVVSHISNCHPLLIHKTTRKKRRRHGMNWSKEDLSDPNKEFSFTSRDLEMVDGKYKCFECSYSSRVSTNVSKHITRLHPRFVFKRLRKYWSRSDNSLHAGDSFDSSNAKETQIEEIRASSSMTSPNAKRLSLRKRESINYDDSRNASDSSFHTRASNEEMTDDHDSYLFDHVSLPDDHAIDYNSDRTERRVILIEDNVHKDGRSFQDRTAHDQYHTQDVSTLLPMYDATRGLSNTQRESVRPFADINECRGMYHQNLGERDIHPIFASNVIEIDSGLRTDEMREAGKDRRNADDSHKNKHVLLRDSQVANEHLDASCGSLNASHDNEVARLEEGFGKKYELDLNQLLSPKEERRNQDCYLSTVHRVPELLRQLEAERKKVTDLECSVAAKEKEFAISNRKTAIEVVELKKNLQLERELLATKENLLISKDAEYAELKSKIEEVRKWSESEFESEKMRELKVEFQQREEDLTKKLADAKSELAKCKKMIMLKEKAEQLRREEELANKAKEERLREMEKIEAELSFINEE